MTAGTSELNTLIPVKGIRVAACSAGLYKNTRLDLAVIELLEGTSCSAVFTRNVFCAAPVKIARTHLESSSPRYCVINAGNANAGMGLQGEEDALSICECISEITHCAIEEILPFSTGVIGEPLPVNKISKAIPELLGKLSEDVWVDIANSIITTDTRPKGISKKFKLDGNDITITGITKGSGMIKPNMATMLSYVATDANIEKYLLDEMLKHAVNHSFNRISVDGDTSTNDACVFMATGQSSAPVINSDDSYIQLLKNELTDICIYLAKEVVRDGEGATKFVTIEVCHGVSEEECKLVGYSIANSPLVKTALFASDANWGRILAAVGYAGVESLDINNISIYLNNICVVKDGEKAEDYSESQGQKIMKHEEIVIRVILNRGDAEATIWTCDLSHEYVRINAEYRT
jgi:glutamate N-acetyltransferase/amino-acid N-acetyltransferase